MSVQEFVTVEDLGGNALLTHYDIALSDLIGEVLGSGDFAPNFELLKSMTQQTDGDNQRSMLHHSQSPKGTSCVSLPQMVCTNSHLSCLHFIDPLPGESIYDLQCLKRTTP